MKARPEDLKPPCFLSAKSKSRPPCEEKPYTHAPTSSKMHKLDGLKANRRYGDFLQDPGTRQSSAAVAPCHSPTTPLPKIKQKPSSRISRGSERRQDHDVSTALPFLQPVSSAVEDTVFKEADASLFNINNTNSLRKRYPTEQEPLQSPASLCQSSLSDLSCPTSPFSRSLDLSGRSSILSNESFAESQSTSPEGIICSPVVHSSPVASRHASLPLYSPTNLSTSSLISTKLDGQTKARLLPLTSPVLLCKPEDDKVQESSTENVQAEFSHNITLHSARSSSHRSPLMSSADTLSFKRSPSSPVRGLESLWPVLPPISTVEGLCPGLLWPLAPGSAARETDPQRKFCAALSLTYQMQRPPTVTPNLPEKPKWCTTAACCSSELSCRESQVFDELDAIAPLSASSPSLDQLSESSYSASKDTDVSPGLAALTVCCDSGNLGSLSRVQLLLLNRQEPQSPFSLDEDLDNYADIDMNNGVWRPLTAGSASEKCGSIRKAHQNKPDDLEDGSGSPCSWIIDPSPSYNMLKSSDSQCNFGLGSSEDEGVIFYTQSNYSRLNEEDVETCSTVKRIEEDRFRRREERKTKVLKMLSKLQDSSPHRPASCKGHSNFEDFDFLAKYCIFNQEKLAEYKQAFEEEDTDGDGYISCLQVLCALKSIIPPELLSEEEEIYVYRILEMVDFRVTDGLVDLRLFAVIASLAQKIATMDEFMRSLISSIDFRSLEVKLFKAKKLFLCLLEEQTSDGMPQQKYISPEQLILELKAGGICLEQEAAIRMELQHIPPLDLLDFLAHLPLFMLIHRSVIANPLDDFSHL